MAVLAIGEVFAQGIGEVTQDLVTSPADPLLQEIYSLNPAVMGTDQKALSALLLNRTVKKSYIAGNTADDSPPDITVRQGEQHTGLAGQQPLGGAAIGVLFVRAEREWKVSNSERAVDFTETKSDRQLNVNFGADITPSVRGAFSYRYYDIERDVFGSFNLDEEERTKYKGTLTGFSIGTVYHQQTYQLGAFYFPAMRGKSQVIGEQKILTVPGITGFQGNLNLSRFSLGLLYKSWLYKRDDRGEVTPSPINQRDMSLNGLDLDQFLYAIDSMQLGVIIQLRKNIQLGASLFQKKAVFMFSEDAVPGDQRDQESAINYQGLQLFGNLQNGAGTLHLRLGAVSANRSIEAIEAGRFVLGTNEFNEYKATEDRLWLQIAGFF